MTLPQCERLMSKACIQLVIGSTYQKKKSYWLKVCLQSERTCCLERASIEITILISHCVQAGDSTFLAFQKGYALQSSRSLSCYSCKRGKKGYSAAGRGRRLRWPAGRRKVAETTCLLLAGGVGSRFSPRGSRSKFPIDVDEATAAAASWNKYSRVLPRPVGAPLRYRRRARGGRALRVVDGGSLPSRDGGVVGFLLPRCGGGC